MKCPFFRKCALKIAPMHPMSRIGLDCVQYVVVLTLCCYVTVKFKMLIIFYSINNKSGREGLSNIFKPLPTNARII